MRQTVVDILDNDEVFRRLKKHGARSDIQQEILRTGGLNKFYYLPVHRCCLVLGMKILQADETTGIEDAS